MIIDVRETGIWLHKIFAGNNESYTPRVLEESQFGMSNLGKKARTISRYMR